MAQNETRAAQGIRCTSDVITGEFVARWEPEYKHKKYPVEFYLTHAAIARNADRRDQLRDALLALLHWKDGRALNFIPGEIHAKNLGPIITLGDAELQRFAELFYCLVEATDEKVDQLTEGLRDVLVRMWNSVVIPAFVLHVARPERLPIVDQHTMRAFLYLIRGQYVKNPDITWDLWKDYAGFFQGAVAAAGFSCDPTSRHYVDRALFAYGKWLKESYPLSASD